MLDLQQLFVNEFNGLAKLANTCPGTWQEISSSLSYLPVAYTRDSLEYQYAYMSAFVDELIDISVVLYQKDRIIGFWPLSLRKKDGVYEFATNQGAVLPPVYLPTISERLIKKYDSLCLEAMKKLYDSNKDKVSISSKWVTTVSFLASNILSQNILWEQKCMLLGAVPRVLHGLYVDLSREVKDIHGNLRKSYRSLINEGERLWQVEVHDKVSDEVFEEFHQLHIAVSGRVTRPKDTWDLQKRAINGGQDFLVTVRDGEQVLRGGGLFECSSTEGCYAVGAYDRNLFDKPVSHVVQWTAIKHLKETGRRWHYVGQRFYPGDIPSPTPKELQIAYFKEGFATDTVLTLLLSVDLEKGALR